MATANPPFNIGFSISLRSLSHGTMYFCTPLRWLTQPIRIVSFFGVFPLAQAMSERKEPIQASVVDFQSPHTWSCEAEGYQAIMITAFSPLAVAPNLKLQPPICSGSR